MRGGSAARPHAARRQAARTRCSNDIAGSTPEASTRSRTTQVCGAVAPARAARPSPCTASRAHPSSSSRRAGVMALPVANGRAQHSAAGPTQRPSQQGVVNGRDAAALQPAPGQLQPLREAAASEGLPGRRQTQCQQVPADHFSLRRQCHAHFAACLAAAVGQRLHRQPLEPRAGRQLELHALQRNRAFAAVETRRAGRGDERVAEFSQRGMQLQFIATDDAARRVQHDVVADRGPFGVQALQYTQRTFVRVVRERLLAVAPVLQFEAGLPAHAVDQKARCTAAISSSTAATGPMISIAFCPRAKTSRHGRSSVGFWSWLPVNRRRRLSLRP